MCAPDTKPLSSERAANVLNLLTISPAMREKMIHCIVLALLEPTVYTGLQTQEDPSTFTSLVLGLRKTSSTYGLWKIFFIYFVFKGI